jgi:hypothetical protein
MTNPTHRTETARDHDDSAMIDNVVKAPDGAGSSGGNLQRDVGTQGELHRVDDPDSHERATKQDDIDNNQAYPSDRARGA